MNDYLNPSETILVIDDEAELRMNIRAFLEDLGYQVREAGGGKEALEAALRDPPDLIMLDVRMPGMSGFEVCAKLKGDARTAAIPVLFLSGLLDVPDKVRAFASGAVDYVTKPFHFSEVQARVQAHLELARQRRELREQHEALRRLEGLRDSFTHMAAHDMRTPLAGIIAALELALAERPDDPGLRLKLEMAHARAADLDALITQMLELSRMESDAMPLECSVCDLALLAGAALDRFRPARGGRRLTLTAPGPVQARCDPAILDRVLQNLLGNAMKFTREDGSVELAVSVSAALVRVTVADDGPGIAEEFQAGIFDKFRQGPGGLRGSGLGLGLAFCRSAVEAHRGRIGVVSRPGAGCTFWFTLPAL